MQKFLHQLRHYLIPHESNNHRSKLLHEQTLLLLIFCIIATTAVFNTVQQQYPAVLGVTANISNQDLLTLTNQQRAAKGLKPLTLNTKLSEAAAEKAKFMFQKDFWAHVSPDGVTPWYFFKQVGYDYSYAGENLARGYNTAPDVVSAWMASPSHRENILSPNYAEIGFATATGTLTGIDNTVLVVELFGTQASPADEQISDADSSTIGPSPALISQAPVQTVPKAQVNGAATQQQPLFDGKWIRQNIGISLVSLLIGVLILDAIIIERKKIVRVVAHNVDHIAFLVMILLIVVLLGRGHIL